MANEYEVNNPNKTLADCDIYESKVAGNALKWVQKSFNLKVRKLTVYISIIRKMLSLGSSVPWNDALEVMTGERKMDASALVEYFAPLYEWLKDANNKLNAHVGW